ncbi:MAG TPA: hypothetical protein VKA43_03195, partial [Gammaproteobacteria bacterium]|nr:hypothetical protein [Gammaproteobacteria bacterium]
MSLRLQLLAVGLLTLVLPWTGLRYVQEMETALRAGLEQSLLARAATVAAALEEQNTAFCPPAGCTQRLGATIYAAPLATEPELDGVRDDAWNALGAPLPVGLQHQLSAGTFGRFAYLFLTVADDELVYQRGPLAMPYGDRVVLAVERADGPDWRLLNTAAPGTFRSQETSPDRFEPSEVYDARIIGAWAEIAGGYALEVRVPMTFMGDTLAIGVIDVDSAGGDYTVELAATWDSESGATGRFIHQRPELLNSLGQLGQENGRLRVLDGDGWILAVAGRVAPQAADAEAATLSGALFRWLLEREDPPPPREQPEGRVADETLRQALSGAQATAWYGSGPDREAIVAAAVPIAGTTGAVVLEQASEPILTLTDRARARLMALMLLATFIVGAGLVGYAT